MLPVMYQSGAVYNNYLAKQMNFPDDELQRTVKSWDGKSLVRKILSAFNPLVDGELQDSAARDIFVARENPQGEVADRINRKIDAYRKA